MKKKSPKDKDMPDVPVPFPVLEGETVQNAIKLMEIYLSDWKHRDDLLWKQVFKFFYATLIVILLPYLTSAIEINVPATIPNLLFYILGLIMSVIFLYISWSYAKRLEAMGNTYKYFISMLPEKYRRLELDCGPIVKKRISKVVSVMMFIVLFLLSIGLVYLDYFYIPSL